MFKEYLLQNWPLILILLAFIISLVATVYIPKRTKLRMYLLIGVIFLLSIAVFVEFYIAGKSEYKVLRTILTAIRYSMTPLIIAQISMALIKKMNYIIFIPALIVIILNIVSIFTGIVFSVDEANSLVRGPIWTIPYIAVGLYSVFLIYLLIRRSNRRPVEIASIVFLTFSLGSGLVLPFILKDAYANIFCVTIAIALFSYHEFTILQLTTKDSLTGLLNRYAYYADISRDTKSITALISLDMNGLKYLNDTKGHAAGDEGLVTLALCFGRPLSNKQSAYRVGGDEFIIVCRKTSKEDVLKIIEKINKYVDETKYTCSVGYSLNIEGNRSIDEMLIESDQMMYVAKAKHYQESGYERRKS